MAMTRSQIFARHVKMARAALGLGVRDFAAIVGVAPNTISNVENARVTLSATIEAIEEKLSHIEGLGWMRDNGKMIGIRLRYDVVPHKFKEATKLRALKKGRERPADRHLMERGKIGSDYPLDKLMRETADHEKRHARDKRVRINPSGNPVRV
jgi:DNA-binding XRE family transcriptional regulator